MLDRFVAMILDGALLSFLRSAVAGQLRQHVLLDITAIETAECGQSEQQRAEDGETVGDSGSVVKSQSDHGWFQFRASGAGSLILL